MRTGRRGHVARAATSGLALAVAGLGIVARAEAIPLPVIVAPAITGTLGDTGWYLSDVTFGWTIIDFGGEVSSTSGCTGTDVITDDTTGYSRTCSVTTATGTTDYTATVQRDATGPTVTLTPDRDPDANGWYRDEVTFTPTGEDATSGVDGCSGEVTHGDADGDGTFTATGDCFDVAGNITYASLTYHYDSTPPTITAAVEGTLVGGVYNGDVTVTFACADETSGIATCPAPQVISDGGDHTIQGTAADVAGNTASTSTTFTIQSDVTPPTITADLSSSPAPSGWWNATTGAPTVTFTCSDDGSGVAACSGPYAFGEGAGQSHTGAATDVAGNTATNEVTGVDVDLTAPTPEWTGGPADGSSHVFGSVPAAPTCTTVDTLSGDGGCTVTGYSAAVGTHTLTAIATDVAGNVTSDTRTYTVTPWTLVGFAKPIESSGTTAVFNSVKKGGAVTLKFEIFAAGVELTTPASVQGVTTDEVTCAASPTVLGPVAATTSGVVYKAGSLQVGWKAPAVPNSCYRVTAITADGSTLAAFFMTKK